MKLIISSLYLEKCLSKVLKDKGFKSIEFKNKCILFLKNNDYIHMDVEYVNFDNTESIDLDRIQWYKILQFLKSIPEQPIVLEFFDYPQEDVIIRLSQFVIDF